MKSKKTTEESKLNIPDITFFSDEVREGFYISPMMKRFWAAEIEVLSHIDRVCRKHNINWYADCGTLLGAIRHGGFIPWDDDLDICMLRDDWVKFFKVAKEELPSEYKVLNLDVEPEYRQMIGRIVNAHDINLTDEHMNEYHGCPYCVGIDIFPLDALNNDPDKEEARRAELLDLTRAVDFVESGNTESAEARDLFRKIEKNSGMILHRNGDILRDLRLIGQKTYMRFDVATANHVGLMPYWTINHDHKYPKELFKDTLLVPFEYTTIRVPARYDQVLDIEYAGWFNIYKGGGVHEYPVYHSQEEILKEVNDANPYRYTMPGTVESTGKKALLTTVSEVVDTLKTANAQLVSLRMTKNTELAGSFVLTMIKLSNSIENYVFDDKYKKAIEERVEEYCDLVKDTNLTADYKERLDSMTDSIRELFTEYADNKHKEILIIVTKAEWFVNIMPYYKEIAAAENTDVYVMPIPYVLTDKVLGGVPQEKDDSDLLRGIVPITGIDEYDIENRHPDMIITQYAYDGWAPYMDIPEFFYSENLAKYTDNLTYVPAFNMEPPIDENDKVISALKPYIETPAVRFADTIILANEKIKKVYIDTLNDITDDGIDYWEARIKLIENIYVNDKRGSSSAEPDKTAKMPHNLPAAWAEKAHGRKVMLFTVSGAFILERREEALDKIESALKTIKEGNMSLVCLWSPLKEIKQIEEIEPELWVRYQEITKDLPNDCDVIYDDENLVVEHMDFVTAYYGNETYLANMCRDRGIPVMLLRILE